MCRIRNFLCCFNLESGGIFLGYLHFLFGLSAFITTSVITMWILAKHPSFVYFILLAALLIILFGWIICSWCLIEGVKYREAKNVCRFKYFSIFCLVLKFAGLVAVSCAFFEVGVVRKKNFDEYAVPMFGISHVIIVSILWEIYILIVANSLEKKFEKEEDLPTRILSRNYNDM